MLLFDYENNSGKYLKMLSIILEHCAQRRCRSDIAKKSPSFSSIHC